MKRLKYYLRNIWQIITRGKILTPREKLFEQANKRGYTIHKIPKRYKGSKSYRKAPRIAK